MVNGEWWTWTVNGKRWTMDRLYFVSEKPRKVTMKKTRPSKSLLLTHLATSQQLLPISDHTLYERFQ